MFSLHPIASHKLKCNRHQFFHAVHHITGIQDFHIHREFFLTKVHEMPQVDGQVLLFRQLQNKGCAVVTASRGIEYLFRVVCHEQKRFRAARQFFCEMTPRTGLSTA